jgi:hypothetical protein
MSTPAASVDSPPDWSAPFESEIECPLCDYNLRGLAEPRCPECGYSFTWAELIAGRQTHRYLFEQQHRRNWWSFWMTYWNDSLPWKFWNELKPTQEVNVRRLLRYWIFANGVTVLLSVALLIRPLMLLAQIDAKRRAHAVANPPVYYNAFFDPQPWSWGFFAQVAYNIKFGAMGLSWVRDAAVALLWTWMSLATLMIFQASMRQAKVKSAHVLRVAIYGCDFVVTIAVLHLLLVDTSYRDSWNTLVVAGGCGVVGTFRMSIAFRKYLRFHLPFLTVLASQMIVFILVCILMLKNYRLF